MFLFAVWRYPLSITWTGRKPTSGSPSHLSSPSQMIQFGFPANHSGLCLAISSCIRGEVKGKLSGLDSSSDPTLGRDIVVKSTHSLDPDH